MPSRLEIELAMGKGRKGSNKLGKRARRSARRRNGIETARGRGGIANIQVGIGRKFAMAKRELQFSESNRHAKWGNGLKVRGCDYYGSITTPSSVSEGSVLINQIIALNQFDQTRIKQFGALFERYQVNSWRFYYVPAVASTVQGQLLMYPEYDVADSVGSNPMRSGLAHMGSDLFNVYTETSIQFVHADPFTDLFVSPDGTDTRLSAIGKLIVLAGPNVPASTALGSIYMEYDIDFYIPCLNDLVSVSDTFTSSVIEAFAPTQTNFSVTTGNQIPLAVFMDSTPAPVNGPFDQVYKCKVRSAGPSLSLGGKQVPSNQEVEAFIRLVDVSLTYNSTNVQSGGGSGSAIGGIYSTLSKALDDSPTIASVTGTVNNLFKSGMDLSNLGASPITSGMALLFINGLQKVIN